MVNKTEEMTYTVTADAASSLTHRLTSDRARGNSSSILVTLIEPAGSHTVHSAAVSAYIIAYTNSQT